METLEYLTVLRKRWVAVSALTAAFGAAGLLAAQVMPAKYEASSSVFVSTPRGTNTTELVQGATFTQNLVQSYAELATMPAVLEPVIADLDLDATPAQLASAVTAAAPLDTVIIRITVEWASAEGAADLANAVAAQLAAAVAEVSPKGADGEPAIDLSIVSTATPPSGPASPKPLLFAALGLAGGLALGVMYALGRHVLDTRVNGEADLRRVTELPVLARFARYTDKDRGVVMRMEPHSLDAEEYRRLRTNLEFADVDGRVSSVVVTSALPGEGKSTTALNLALALAERSSRVLLVDADLRNPTVATLAQVDGSVGLTSVLVGSATLNDAIQSWGDTGLQILPSGKIPPNPNQLLSSEAMAGLVENLVSVYDYVVIDSPPLVPVTDALTMARLAGGTLVVTRDRSTRRAEVGRALESLALVNANVLGVVMTNTTALPKQSRYGYENLAAGETMLPVAKIARLQAPASRKTDAAKTRESLATTR